jgi:cobalamin biosynthesis Mg chelatase CobN
MKKNSSSKSTILPQITIISAMVCTRSLTDAIQEIQDELGVCFTVKILFLNALNSGEIPKEVFIQDIYNTKIMLIDIRGHNPAVEILLNTYREMESTSPDQFKKTVIISLVGGNQELRCMTKLGSFEAKKIPSKSSSELNFDEIPDLTEFVKKGIRIGQKLAKIGKKIPIGIMRHIRNWTMAMDYWVYGYSGIPKNHKNLFLMLLKEYLHIKTPKLIPPLKIPPFGIFDPVLNQFCKSLNEYEDLNPLDPEKQTIGIFYYGGLYFEQTLPIIKAFMHRLKDYNLIPLYSEVLDNLQAQQEFFFKDGAPIISAVINLQYFQINGGPFGGNNSETLNLYKKFNVPQFNPVINFDMNYSDYLASQEGMSPINQVIAVTMPELDGRIEMMTVGCMEDLGFSDNIQASVLDIHPIDETIELYCQRIQKWLNLRIKPNHEKKIALIVYDYPPGESTLGNASYLDVSKSVSNILTAFQKEGYIVQDVPENFSLSEILLDAQAVNDPKHTNHDNFKGIRIASADYLQLYSNFAKEMQQKIEKVWGPPPGSIMINNNELLIPILEFGNVFICLQPARGNYLNIDSNNDNNNISEDYHDSALPPPHQYIAFYRYLEDIIDVDAIVHVGTHGTLEFLPGKECVGHKNDFNINLLGCIPNLYLYHISNTSESSIAKRRSNAVIISHATPALTISELYAKYEQLEFLLTEYNSNSQITNDNRDSTESNSELVNQIQNLAAELDLKYENFTSLENILYRLKISVVPNGLHIFGQPYNLQEVKDLLLAMLLHSPAVPQNVLQTFHDLGLTDEERVAKIKPIIEEILNSGNLTTVNHNNISAENLEEIFSWIQDLNNRLTMDLELSQLIHSLEGGYILPGLGGDPIRTPEIFPTGRNSFGFDPRLIPSTTACERGKKIALSLLDNYYRENSAYPETVSVVLWAFETMKTGGETVGQIFEYLGVRAVKSKSVWTTELELIPLQELGHPRINVLTTICGIFRDTLPSIMELVNKAVELVGGLEESLQDNYIRKSNVELSRQGVSYPTARVFGPPPGKYNTNLTDIISKSAWETEKDLASDYLQNMGYAYFSQQIRNVPVAAHDSFKETIRHLDLISQVRDSSEYQVTDLDHYYEFTGGLASSYQSLTGKSSQIYIADTSSVEISINTIDKSVQEGVITRNLNPKWINGMLSHKYHGGQKVSERVENLLGLAATTHSVENWIWDRNFETYIADEKIRKKMIENNRYATMDMIETLIEAERREYWSTSEENINQLKKIYLELESWVEIHYQ